MSVELRTMTEDDLASVRRIDELAFGFTWADDTDMLGMLERDRTLLARLDGADAGLASAFTQRMSVPGGRLVPCAGVTWVGVVPTARRRGVLTALMRRQLADVRAAGEPVAALWASEAAIYGRFGYGVASTYLSLRIARGDRALRDTPVDAGARALPLRIVEPGDALGFLAAVEGRAARLRPGTPVRDAPWWARAVGDPPSRRDGASALRALLVGGDDDPRGYGLYATSRTWGPEGPHGTVSVREAVAVDPAAHAALWRQLLAHDFMDEWVAGSLPADDPLLRLLAEPRRARPTWSDQLHVRVVDVPAALTARGYAAEVDVVLEVRDALLGDNAGRWRVSTGADGASCGRTSEPADLVLDVRELGAAYLGGTTLGELADAGLVEVRDEAALEAAGAAFAARRAPWCPRVF